MPAPSTSSAPPRRGQPRSLERRPEARPYSIELLLEQVVDGRVRIPPFQRDLKWDVADAIELLDSIHKGYPIGTLLFWQRSAEADTLRYGSVIIQGHKSTDALWVVDGQQRVTSLVRVLLGQGYPEEHFAIFFDLETGRFVRPRRKDSVPSHFVPLTEVLDSERLIAWLLDHGQDLDRAPIISLGKRIREYQVPAYIVRTDDEHAVREIFRRSNSTGKRMEEAEVFNALYGARHGRPPADLRGICDALERLGAGKLDVGILHTMMLATLGTDISKNRVPDLSPSEAAEAMRMLEQVGRSIIGFLLGDVGIPHLALLPYTQPLVTLARFFCFHPEPHKRSRELLARWIWRGALTGLHRGDTMSTRRNLEVIDASEHATVQALLANVPPDKRKPISISSFNFRYAMGKVQALALFSLRPRHFENNAELVTNGSADGGGLFPPSVLVKRPSQRSTLASRIIHPPIAGGLRRAIVSADDRETLASHAITPPARDALARDEVDTFLRLRSEFLGPLVEAFVQRHTRWGESDRPPLSELVVPDQGD